MTDERGQLLETIESLKAIHELSEQLAHNHLSLEQVSEKIHQSTPLFSSFAIEDALSAADQALWSAPCTSWCLAQAAHSMAQASETASMLIELPPILLTLGVAACTLGYFEIGISHLQQAAPTLLSQGHLIPAARCLSEAAIALGYRGDTKGAQSVMSQLASHLTDSADELASAYHDRAAGHLQLMQNNYQEAALVLQQAADAFATQGCMNEAALSWCDAAIALRFVALPTALSCLKAAREVRPADPALHDARCDYVAALICEEQNDYVTSLALYEQATPVFEEKGVRCLRAWCDLGQGIVHQRLNQYEAALKAYKRARPYFLAQGFCGEQERCDLNIAVVYYELNRYAEALGLYRAVADRAQSEGRHLRVAYCYTNMGLCYDRLGRYDRALPLHERARHLFIEAEQPVYAAISQENLAGTYRMLGQSDHALQHYKEAYARFKETELTGYLAQCATQIARLHLQYAQPTEAQHYVEEALAIYEVSGMEVSQAHCIRLLAHVEHQRELFDRSMGFLDIARPIFAAREMVVDVALCDLLEGQIYLDLRRISYAEACFRRAHAVLAPGLPDQAWQAEVGLAECAAAKEAKREALSHYISATHFIAQMRDALPTEEIGSQFFDHRHSVYKAAIHLAIDIGDVNQAFSLVEQSKARTLFLPKHLQSADWDDPYLVSLKKREAALRQRIESLHTQLSSAAHLDPAQRDQEKLSPVSQINILEEMKQAKYVYERVAEQLRTAGGAVDPLLSSSFILDTFRTVASNYLPPNWSCFSYYYLEDQLLVFFLTTEQLDLEVICLTPEEKRLFQYCISQTEGRQELIYGGTLRGFAIPNDPGKSYRQQLGKLLFPQAFIDKVQDSLLLIPHAALHGLPFHTLYIGNTLLLERASILYAPSLPVMQALWKRREDISEPSDIGTWRGLVVGLGEFVARAPSLPHAAYEVAFIKEILQDSSVILYGSEATPASVARLIHVTQEPPFDILHFATHAIAEPSAPLLSRILLTDGDLTVLDILEMNLTARLVILSACQSATGTAQPGDEMTTLARAFIHAGARAVMASLWRVDDEATSTLMRYFYDYLQQGKRASQALQLAQQHMKQAGYSAFQWGSFLIIGTD